jgi:threonine/homoserine/homoserine lactone efflux protein
MILVLFFATFIISFLGSIHPGPLNVSVVEITLKNSLKAGLIMAFGGVIPEVIYSWIAVEGVLFFRTNQLIFNILRWAMVGILLVMAVLAINAKSKNIKNKEVAANSFFKGLFLSMLNPQLIVFWLLIVVYYQGFELLKIDSIFDKIAFILGAALGAFALNYLYASWAFAKRDFIFKHINQKLFNLLIGGSFIAMAILQIIKLIYN